MVGQKYTIYNKITIQKTSGEQDCYQGATIPCPPLVAAWMDEKMNCGRMDESFVGAG